MNRPRRCARPGSSLVLTVAIAVVAIAFALPAARSKPHDVPIGAAGPQAASGQVADILEQTRLAPSTSPTTPAKPRCETRSAIATSTAASRSGPTAARCCRHRRQPDRRPAAEPGRQRHRATLRGPAAHRRPGPADRRRPSRRRAGGVGTADNTGRNAARHRAGARAPARGVDPVHGRSGVRWAGRLHHRGVAAIHVRLDRRELLGRSWRAHARRTRLRAVHARPRLACSAASGWASAPCSRCCWETRCRA